jgi:hypothetical protein
MTEPRGMVPVADPLRNVTLRNVTGVMQVSRNFDLRQAPDNPHGKSEQAMNRGTRRQP